MVSWPVKKKAEPSPEADAQLAPDRMPETSDGLPVELARAIAEWARDHLPPARLAQAETGDSEAG